METSQFWYAITMTHEENIESHGLKFQANATIDHVVSYFIEKEKILLNAYPISEETFKKI